MLINVDMYTKSISPEKALLSQVILLAINDACFSPDPKARHENKAFVSNESIRMHTNTFTAMRFLFDRSVSGLDEYSAWLDFDPSQFRRKLTEMMRNDGPNIINGYSSMQRRYFRINKRIYDALAEANSKNLDIEVSDDND